MAEDSITANAVEVTIADLARHPSKYDGRLVRVDALLVYGWEGDDFLTDPTPQSTRPLHLWFYCKPEHEKDIAGACSADRASVEAWFTGYFHFVPDHRPNAMFDPGPLQMEAIQVLDRRPSRSMSTAIRRGDLEEARRIVHSGAKLNVRDEYQSFPLAEASELGDADFVEDLLNAGADPNLDGGDALRKAARHCKVDAAKVLLAHGASVNVADVNGETALMSSSTCADGVMAQVLLDAKADPNAKAKGGTTALMAAARNPRVAEKLINAGADPGAKNDYGGTAESESCNRGAEEFYQVCQLVRAALAKANPKN